MYPKHLSQLITSLQRFPGVGYRSAERFAFDLLRWNEKERSQIAQSIAQIQQQLKTCSTCGCLCDLENACFFCGPSRDSQLMVLVANIKDVYSIEESGSYRGLYHVLGGMISPLEGVNPEDLNIETLFERLPKVDELIFALDATVDGDATSLYVKQEIENRLKDKAPKMSRIAFGIPLGGSLDYTDGATLGKAVSARGQF